MMVMDVTSCILLLEVDENAHQSSKYTVAGEASRMADVNAYLRLRGYDQPIYWLRFNPDGKYFVGGKQKIVSREERELALKHRIRSMVEPGYTPSTNVTVEYMFY
ncbi:unnamed protein product, partial [Ectocarpus sp. 8 AP-2014]